VDVPAARPRSPTLPGKWALAFLVVTLVITLLQVIDYFQGRETLHGMVPGGLVVLLALSWNPRFGDRTRAGFAICAAAIALAWIVIRLAG
jgi:hypothetical protein